jgi:O-antigen/teichoic acid export membrane protein
MSKHNPIVLPSIVSKNIQQTNLSYSNNTSSSFNRRVLFAVTAGWGNKTVSILVNLIQIPLLFRYLDEKILGVWFLMIGAQMLIGIFDFGFGQTLQRRIAFAKGTCGANPDTVLSEEARQLIRDLLAMSKRVYFVLSGVVLLVLLIGGPVYINTLDLSDAVKSGLSIAWIIIAFGYAANMWGWYVEATLNGLGDIGYLNVINGVLWVAMLAATWIVLISGGGIFALAIVWIMRGILLRLFGWIIVRLRHPWIRLVKGKWHNQEFQTMIRPALQWWVAIVGTFFLTGVSRYFVGSYLGVSAVADYVATFTALVTIQVTLSSILGVSTPLLSQMWRAGDIESMRLNVFRLTRLSLILLTMSYAFVCVYGKEIFELWLGEGHFVGYPVLITLAVMMILEAHQSMLNVSNIASEKLEFYKYTVLAGVLSVILQFFLTPVWGLIGVSAAILIAEVTTIDWIVPVLSFKLLDTKVSHYLFSKFMPVISVGILCATLLFLWKMMIPGLVWSIVPFFANVSLYIALFYSSYVLNYALKIR